MSLAQLDAPVGALQLYLLEPSTGRALAPRAILAAGTAAAAALASGRPLACGGNGASSAPTAPLFLSAPTAALVVPLHCGRREMGCLNLAFTSAAAIPDPVPPPLEEMARHLGVALAAVARLRRAREAEGRLRAGMEASARGVLVIDLASRRVLEANAAAASLTGYGRSELLVRDLLGPGSPGEAVDPLRILRGLLRRGRVGFEADLRRADAAAVPVRVEAVLERRHGRRLVHCEIEATAVRARGWTSREREVTRCLLEGSGSVICSVDARGRIRLVNRRLEELTGRGARDLRAVDPAELVPERARASVVERLRGAFAGEDLARYEVPLRLRDGGEALLLVDSSVARDGAGRPRELVLVGTDVTASREYQDSLAESVRQSKTAYQQLREFAAVSSVILQEKDLDRICGLLVQALREHSNFQRAILTLLDDQFRGHKWFFAGLSPAEIDTFHRNRLTSDQRVTIFQERFRLGNSYYIPHDAGWNYIGVRSTRDAGQMVDWHPDDFLFIPLYGSNRKMVGIVSVDDPRDGKRPTAETISPIELFANQVAHAIEQAKLDAEVRRSTEKYRTLVDSMNDGLLAVDLTNRVTFVNPALTELIGFPEHALLQRSIHRLLGESDRDVFRQQVRDRQRHARFEVTLITRAGEKIPALVSASPFYQSGQLVGTFAIVSDLREQKKAQAAFQRMHQEIVAANERLQSSMEELRRTQEQLIQAEKLSALGELISGVAHELNNPLTGVMGYAQLLLGAGGSERLQKDLEKIHREASRCQRIVQNLLTFARRRAPERGPVEINEILEATVELRAYQLKVDNIQLTRDLQESLPVTTGDPHQLQQVFINLINNAHQAMVAGHGRGHLRIRTTHTGDRIRIVFQDDGPGIPEDKIGKIFDPFFTTKEPGQGTGLGLSLSYGIIREHEGQIRAASAPGHGATFVVELPVREPEPTAVAADEQAPAAADTEGKRILVVDDEEVILDLLESILATGGHRVETARNGRAALEKVRAGHYDLIISDLKMPDLGGQGLYESVRAIDPDLSRRMIFSTGDTMNPSTQAFFRQTGNTYLAKPFRLEEVDRAIRAVLAAVPPSRN